MSARRLGAIAAGAALALAAASPAAASLRLEAGVVVMREDRPADRELIGPTLTFVTPSDNWLAFEARLEMARQQRDDIAGATVGMRVGPTRGRLRPFADVMVGLAVGRLDFAGSLSAYGVGADLDLTRRVGMFVHASSLNSANFEYDGHLAQYRVGIMLQRPPHH